MSKQTVFVSGATGFIAQHIIKQLLSTDKYKVIGSVRAGSKAEKLKADFDNNTTDAPTKDLKNVTQKN